MKTGNKLGLRLTSTGCQSTRCPSWRCNPRPIEGYYCGNLGIAKISYKIPVHGPWKGSKVTHMPGGFSCYFLKRDGGYVGMHLKSKKEAEELAGCTDIDWKETCFWDNKSSKDNKLNIRIKK